MPDREYPRWIHHPEKKHPSVVVHSPEEEDAKLAEWIAPEKGVEDGPGRRGPDRPRKNALTD
jgi:hypothetical protein